MEAGTQAAAEGADVELRPLRADDFDAVVAIDRALSGRSRRGYFEKRLQAAVRNPKGHLQVAALRSDVGGGLVGFVLARVVEGEYGRPEPVVLLEAIGVEPSQQHRGIGRKLLAGLEEVMRHKDIHELGTQSEWTDYSLLRFLSAAGFSLAPRQVLQCPVTKADTLR